MIDPWKITDYNRNQYQLEEYLIFCVAVAGKTAHQIMNALETFLQKGFKKYGHCTPFELIKKMIKRKKLMFYIKSSSLGQHRKLERAFGQLVDSGMDLDTCSVEDLESIHGIGPKTSRFFIVHSRKNTTHAILDTHILKFMREKLKIDTPKNTPSYNKYKELEKFFLDYVRDYNVKNHTSKTIAEMDLDIWTRYARKKV